MPGTVLDAGETKMTKTWYFPSRSSQFSNGNRYLGRQCSFFFYFNFSFYNAQFKKTGKYTHKIKLHIIPSPKKQFFQSFYTCIPLFSEIFMSTTHVILATKQNILRTLSHIFKSSSLILSHGCLRVTERVSSNWNHRLSLWS